MNKKNAGNRIFNLINTFIMLILIVVTIYPIWFSVVNSLNDGTDLLKGYVFLWPRIFTFDSWRTVVADSSMLNAGFISISRTFIVTFIAIFNTAMFSYAFSRKYLRFKKFYTVIGFISMYFSGGIIPIYLVYQWLNIYNTYWVYILPFMFGGFYNVIIFNANYKAIPESLYEAAKMDGANEFKMFLSVTIPLSKAVLAALAVFTASAVWNDYETTLLFTRSESLQTLPYFTLKLLRSSQASEQLQNSASAVSVSIASLANGPAGGSSVTSKTLELASMVLSSLPMILIYPFAQKFFVKGLMVGSVKE